MSILLPVNVCKIVNIVDPDQTPRFMASDLGLYCLLWQVYPSTLSKNGKII